MADRILVLNTELSGVNNYLFSQLKKRGWKLTIVDVPYPKICLLQAMYFSFTPNIFKWKRQYKKKLSKYIKYPSSFKLRTHFCERKLKRKKGEYDVIFQISGMFAPKINYLNHKIPYVTFNDYTMMLSKKYSNFSIPQVQMDKWMKLETDLYKNAKFIFTTSDNTKNSFIEHYGIASEKIISVKYGLTLDNISDSEKIYSNKTILFIGRSFEQKGGFDFLKAFKKVRQEIKDAKLIIVGVNKDFLKIDQPGVEVLGYIRDKALINSLYKKASLFVMPSISEAFGLVFLEAMAHKLPCIGTTVDAMPEIIEDGKTGFLVSPGDIDTLAEKILMLLKNEDLSRKMGEKGHENLNKKFQWDILGEKLDFYLKQCL